MAKEHSQVPKLIFKTQASIAKDALVLIFDLEGFSRFFSQPDVQEYVTKYLNRVFDTVSSCIFGGKIFWSKNDISPFLTPTHVKFLGDGALYIWSFNRGEKEKKKQSILYFINRLWNIKNDFGKLVDTCSEDVPVVDLPRKIRFGLASGSVHKIYYKYSARTEYIGYCINLASRLQGYCRDLGFIASARIGFRERDITKHGYIKVVAKKLDGFPREVVLVDKDEFDDLPSKLSKELFDPV